MVTHAIPPLGAAADAPIGALTLQDFMPLWPAESVLLRAATTGNIAKVSFRRPRTAAPDMRLRAQFLCFLARGGSRDAFVKGRRLQIVGACIVGHIDLAGATVPMSLWLYRCLLDATPCLDGAHVLGSVSFVACAMRGLQAEGCRINGDLALSGGCSIDGEIELTQAYIARDLNCERMHRGGSTPADHKFIADGARIRGDVILAGGFEGVGEVRFTAAHIGGDLYATAARLTAAIDDNGGRGVALNLDRAHVGGSVRLDGGLTAAGQVRLQQARIEGDLDCTLAAFDVAGDASWGDNQATLLLDRARIGGALILRQLREPLQGASLTDARVRTLIDDASTWGEHHVLDGFAYSRLAADAPIDAAMRLGWLERQDALLRGESSTEPWRRLIKVLRRMGHDPSARDVAIGRERHLSRAGLIGRGCGPVSRGLLRAGHGLFGLFAGYGHRPLRLLASVAALWLLGGALYWAAAAHGELAPRAALVLAEPRLADCRPQCAELPPTMPTLHPFAYSLDVMVPMLDLEQERHWGPVHHRPASASAGAMSVPLLQVAMWIQAGCGWLASLVLLAMATGLADRDRGR